MYVYEFLWRGRANGDTAYHVVLADDGIDVFGKLTHVEHGPLTPEQAEALGFSLSTIIAEINTAVLIERDKIIETLKNTEIELDKSKIDAKEMIEKVVETKIKH